MWLLTCLKGPVLENLFTVNLLTDPKHYWNLHDSTLILLFTSFWDELISDILGLFVYRWHWLPITSILAIIRRISRNLFLCNFLKKQKPFVKILLYFPNLHKISNISKKKNSKKQEWQKQIYILHDVKVCRY